MILKEFDQGSFLTAPDHDANHLIGVSSRDLDQDLGERVSVGLIKDEILQALRSRKEIGDRVAMTQSQAEYP
jgi:hypothetical protein